jgi:hypothetical protein
MMQIGPRQQLARLTSELFPSASAGGWVYVLTDTEGMQAFWLTYDGSLTYLDGAEAAQYENTGSDQIVPLATADTQLNVIALQSSGTGVPVTVRLLGAGGNDLAAPLVRSIPIAGAFQAKVSDMFPSADFAQAQYLRVGTSGAPIASSALIERFLSPRDAAVVNGGPIGARTELDFPHVVTGALTGASYTTIIGVINSSASLQAISITFYPSDGSPIQVNRTLAGNGALRETAESLFGLTSDFRTGWVRVTGTAPITGFAAYGDQIAGGSAVVPPATAQTNLFFSHIAEGTPQWQTGLALLNSSASTPASVELYAITPTGSLIGKTAFTIDPGKKIANVLHELVPETRGVNGGYIYVRSTNNVPLFGVELFYTEDLKVLSNVAAGKLVPGVSYAPPQ